MPIAARASGVWASSVAASHTVALPSYEPGNLGLLVVVSKSYLFAATEISQGWTILVDDATGATAVGNGVGSLRLLVAWKILGVGEVAPTVSRAGSVTAGAVIVTLSKAANETWSVARLSSTAETVEQNFVHALTTTATIDAGDWVYAVTGVADDSSPFTRPTDAISGGPDWTSSMVRTPAVNFSSTAGADLAADQVRRTAATTVGSGANLAVTGSLFDVERCGSVLFKVRVTADYGDAIAETVTAEATAVDEAWVTAGATAGANAASGAVADYVAAASGAAAAMGAARPIKRSAALAATTGRWIADAPDDRAVAGDDDDDGWRVTDER
jgi:hypothetical protein